MSNYNRGQNPTSKKFNNGAMLLRIPRKLRDQFKSACALKGSNMAAEIRRFMEGFVAAGKASQ